MGYGAISGYKLYKDNRFYQQLAYILVDIVWRWTEFRSKYLIIDHLKNVFPNVPTLTLSAMIIPIILKYICKLFKLRSLTQLYQKLWNKSNIAYMIGEITKLNYENVAFLMLFGGGTNPILKIMIFVNNIKNA